jgi:Xaa-Pro aminopeptidase
MKTQTGLLQKNIFMHGTSHHMGLDTHDYGFWQNYVLIWATVEPGIYIPAEGLIRLRMMS